MTGKITLSGHVLPVAGVKEKVHGACRPELTRVVPPRQNEKHFERDVRDDVRRRITLRTGAIVRAAGGSSTSRPSTSIRAVPPVRAGADARNQAARAPHNRRIQTAPTARSGQGNARR